MLLTDGITACMVSGIHSEGMHDNNMKDPLRDYVSSKIYSGTMFHQRSTQGLCFIRDPLRDYVSSEIHSGTMFHQRSTQGLCFIKDPLRDYVSSTVHSGTMFHQRSTQGLCFIRSTHGLCFIRDYVSSEIYSGTMFHQFSERPRPQMVSPNQRCCSQLVWLCACYWDTQHK